MCRLVMAGSVATVSLGRRLLCRQWANSLSACLVGVFPWGLLCPNCVAQGASVASCTPAAASTAFVASAALRLPLLQNWYCLVLPKLSHAHICAASGVLGSGGSRHRIPAMGDRIEFSELKDATAWMVPLGQCSSCALYDRMWRVSPPSWLVCCFLGTRWLLVSF